jgi:hypothetical protein
MTDDNSAVQDRDLVTIGRARDFLTPLLENAKSAAAA